MFCKSLSTLFILSFVINNNVYAIDYFMSISGEIFNELFEHMNTHLQNYLNLENMLHMNISFQELFNKIQNENDSSSRNKLFQEFCQYIFGDEYNNLRTILNIANNEQLLSIKNTLELESFSKYMKNEYMNLEDSVTTIINTFVEQCQDGFYEDCSNETDFNKLFETFFNETKEKQYTNKITQYDNVINEIQQWLINDTTLKQNIITLLNNKFILVKQHISDIFNKVNDKKFLCYLKVTKGDVYTDPIKI